MKLTNSSAVPALPDIVAYPEKEQNMHYLFKIHDLYNVALHEFNSFTIFSKIASAQKMACQTYQILYMYSFLHALAAVQHALRTLCCDIMLRTERSRRFAVEFGLQHIVNVRNQVALPLMHE